MERVELKKLLETLRVPAESYAIDEVKDESLCLVPDVGCWCVFYSERGNRIEPDYFLAESDACARFLVRIKQYTSR